jgi:hypothetical protein
MKRRRRRHESTAPDGAGHSPPRLTMKELPPP